MKLSLTTFLISGILLTCCSAPDYDLIIRNGVLYDGSVSTPRETDIAINADTIAAIGDLSRHTGMKIIDAKGKSVSPGFINMLSWANVILIEDGRSQGDIRQGVTLDVLGEGSSLRC